MFFVQMHNIRAGGRGRLFFPVVSAKAQKLLPSNWTCSNKRQGRGLFDFQSIKTRSPVLRTCSSSLSHNKTSCKSKLSHHWTKRTQDCSVMYVVTCSVKEQAYQVIIWETSARFPCQNVDVCALHPWTKMLSCSIFYPYRGLSDQFFINHHTLERMIVWLINAMELKWWKTIWSLCRKRKKKEKMIPTPKKFQSPTPPKFTS